MPPDAPQIGRFEFVKVAALRAAQLMRGCVPRVGTTSCKHTTMAQREVAGGKVTALPRDAATRPSTLV